MSENIRAVWSEEQLDEALAALQPATDLSQRTFDQAKTELLVSAGGSAAAAPSRPRRRLGRWGATIAAVGTAAAVVAGLLVVQAVRSDGGTTAASERLNIAADSINTVDEPLGPGQYRYIATHAWWMTTSQKYNYLSEHLIETWVPADQKQDWRLTRRMTGAHKWISGSEANAKEDGLALEGPNEPEETKQAPCGDWAAEEDNREPCTTPGSWQYPTAEFLTSLPRDPDELYDRLSADTEGRGKDESLEMVVYVADLLRTGLAPADLRAALYRALGKVPGLEITEEVANLDGKKGTAFGVSAAGERHDVIIDPATGQFIGERQVAEQGWEGIPPGTVTGYTSVTTAVVSGMGVPGGATPPAVEGSSRTTETGQPGGSSGR